MDFDPEVWFAHCPAKSRGRLLNTWDCHMHAMKAARDSLVGHGGYAAKGTALSSVNKFSHVLTSECDGNDEARKAGRLHDLADRMNDQFQRLFCKTVRIPARNNRLKRKPLGIAHSVRSSAGSAGNGDPTWTSTAFREQVSSVYSPLAENSLSGDPIPPQHLFLSSEASQQLPLPPWYGFTPLNSFPADNDSYSPVMQASADSFVHSTYWPGADGLGTGVPYDLTPGSQMMIGGSVEGFSHVAQSGIGQYSGFTSLEAFPIHSSFSFTESLPELLLPVFEDFLHQREAAQH